MSTDTFVPAINSKPQGIAATKWFVPWAFLARAVCICYAASATAVSMASDAAPATVTQPAATMPSQSAPMDPEQLFALASPAVVKITVLDEQNKEFATGSGFIVDCASTAEGTFSNTIVTNFHVIQTAVSATVSFQGKVTGKVETVLSEDAEADLALLSVVSDRKVGNALVLDTGPKPPVGRRVLTIGSPQGLTNTLSEGIVSGYRQLDDGREWVQITAPISGGSSGGPVFQLTGKVTGVTTAQFRDGQNLNFAIPSGYVAALMKAPRTPRPLWKGVSLFKESDDAFEQVKTDLMTEFREQRSGESRREFILAFHDFRDEKAAQGDQRGLLLRATDQMRVLQAYDGCVRDLQAAIKAVGRYDYLVHYGFEKITLLQQLTDVERRNLIVHLKLSVTLRPDFAPAWSALWSQYAHFKEYRAAIEAADMIIKLRPNCPEGYSFRAGECMQAGLLEQAVRGYEYVAQPSSCITNRP